LLDRLDALAARRHLTRLADLSAAWRVDVQLDLPADHALDAALARSGGEMALQHALSNAHTWRQAQALGLALARWHAEAGRSGRALALLQALEAAACEREDAHHRDRVRVRVALVRQQRGELQQALPALSAALDRIAATRAWQVALEPGLPVKALLRVARQHDPEAVAGTTRALTIQTLLDKLSCEDALAVQLFSERELEVLQELASGLSNKQIARRLSLSENTVKFHLKNLYRKLEAGTREAALGNALQRGLIGAASSPE
jgi:LuxR family maltose regulon positive regulatory protein